MRDDFPALVKDILARRVNYHCSNPKCRRPTIGPHSNPAKTVSVGVASHLTAASPRGPRFDESLSPEQRKSVENGIWLCQICAKLVDNDPVKYTLKVLQDWKHIAEEEARLKLEENSDKETITEVPWPKELSVFIATSSETIPSFPHSLSGYRATGDKDYWGRPFATKGSVRIFGGNDWEPIADFPLTMNHCSYGVFMLRWRSANPDVLVETALGYHYSERIYATKTGTFGYMQGTNCEEPMFKLEGILNRSKANLVDIYYELKFWQAAP